MSEKNKTSTSTQRVGGGMGGGMGGGRGGNSGAMPGDKPKNFGEAIKKLLAYIGNYRWGVLVSLLLAAGGAVLSVFGPKTLAKATNKLFEGFMAMVTGTGSIDFAYIGIVLLFVSGIYVISAILQYVQGYILTTISTKVSYSLRKEISEKINRLPLSYYDKASQGDIISRISNDVDTVYQTLGQNLSSSVSSVASIISILIMMLTINVWMTLITLIILPISFILIGLIMKKSQPEYVKQQEYLGQANGFVEEMYGGHLVVKAFGREDRSLNEFKQINENLHGSAWKSQFFGNLMMPVMNFISNLGYVGVCISGALFMMNGQISVGDIQAFIQYVRQFTQQVGQTANIANTLQQSAAAAERVFEFLEEEEETADPEIPVSPEVIEGDVYFAHVNFGYLPEKTIIHDFSAIIEQGMQVAIVGPTGAGKTTMVKLLMRFYDVNEGAILVDGYDLRQFSRNGLRSVFGMVLQDTWLYNDTIMENIRYGRLDATDAEVIAAAKAAQVHHFIRTMPEGYNTELNEEASNISQGQKQLLTIARTLLSDPKILILDEATSSVDTRTEILIQKAMAELMKGRTSFVIAHRLSTIRDADMILVMKDGDIVETGNHDDLLKQDGFYASLYNSQFETGITA